MTYAPITLFVYNRPDHTAQTIEALQKNTLARESDLIIFSDAPKTEIQTQSVNNVRQYIRQVDGFKSVTIVEREVNYGLAESIISGVTSIVNEYGNIIVLEDDLVTSPFFLRYMNGALDLYEHEEKVISINGYLFPVAEKLPETFFLRGADCWGWATWRRGWALFKSDGQLLMDELKHQKLTGLFNFNGAYPYTKMLEKQIKGHNNSWAVRWYASAFLADKLTLYPGRSLVHNIGNDNSGTHCENSRSHDAELSRTPIDLDIVKIEPSSAAIRSFEVFFLQNRMGVLRRLLVKVSKLLG